MPETKQFRMYGASDDLIECEGIPGCDEFDVNPETGRERVLLVRWGYWHWIVKLWYLWEARLH